MSHARNRSRTLLLAFAIVATLAVVNWLASAPIARDAPAPQSEESEPELEEFVPSEKVPADTAVAFPVDI